MQEISIQWIFEETGNRRFFVYCENIIIFIKKIFMLWIQIKKTISMKNTLRIGVENIRVNLLKFNFTLSARFFENKENQYQKNKKNYYREIKKIINRKHEIDRRNKTRYNLVNIRGIYIPIFFILLEVFLEKVLAINYK